MSVDEEAVRAIQEVCRKDLMAYTQYCDFGKYQPAKFHRLLAKRLEAVTAGRVKRQIFVVPPRFGKSRIVTIEWPTWLMGLGKFDQIMCASHTARLSMRHSIQARQRLLDERYAHIFDTKLALRSASAANWTTDRGGSYKAIGVGGGIMGEGANLLIVDDPLKNYEEAHSQTIRDKIWDWFVSSAMTRLTPDGACVIIMQRWHKDDLVGRLLDPQRQDELRSLGAEETEQWQVVHLRAIAEEGDRDELGRQPGESLWPEVWPVKKLMSRRAVVGSYIWTSHFRGDPVNKDGNYINGNNFVVIGPEALPAGLRWVRFWDLAATDDKKNDETAGIMGALDRKGNLYLKDLVHGRWLWPVARDKIAKIGEQERVEVGVEVVGLSRTTFDNLREVMSNRVMLRAMTEDKEKLTRALPWIALVEAHVLDKTQPKVFLVSGDWITAFKNQCEAFPGGDHDDMVDAVSGVWKMVEGGTIESAKAPQSTGRTFGGGAGRAVGI